MISVLLDTNVVLDFAEKREGFFEAAKKVFVITKQRGISCCVSASAVTDIFYHLQKGSVLELLNGSCIGF